MKHSMRAVVLLAPLAAGCWGAGPSTQSVSPITTSTGITSSPTVEPVRLDPVVLTADLSESPARWRLVANLPFGPGREELGYLPVSRLRSLGFFPASFAVAADRSLWILDSVKQRIAHYGVDGSFLGSVGRFPDGRWVPQDLILTGEQLLALRVHSWTAASDVTVFTRGLPAVPVPLTLNGDPASIVPLVAGARQLTGQSHGYAKAAGHEAGDGPHGWAGLDVPGAGWVTILPGVPLQDGTFMGSGSYTPSEQDSFEVTFQTSDMSSVLPVRVRPVSGPGADPMAGGVSVHVEAATEHGLIYFLRVVLTQRDLAERYGFHLWLLQISQDGSPLVFERLPDPGISDETQTRHLTVGPDGSVYLMVPSDDGMDIYRR